MLLGGTLRWLAPELIIDSLTPLTMEADVYAFAITCVEVSHEAGLFGPLLDIDLYFRFLWTVASLGRDYQMS